MAQPSGPLSERELVSIDAYWRAANYLSVGQIYLLANPLLREPLRLEHTKPRLLGHWGTTPGLNLVYAHMNRLIRERDVDAIFIAGPGHGGPGVVANVYLEGTYTRGLPAHRPRRGGTAAAVPPVLLPRRHPQPRRPGDARLDPRGRRARLLAGPRPRGRLRQPRPARLLRRRRRRGRDGSARDELALEQVPRPRPRWRRAADPAPERLQDREPHRARADPGAGAALAARGLRLRAAVRGGRSAGARAPAAGGGARAGERRDRRDPAPRPQRRDQRAPPLADDRPAHAQGLDGAQGRRRPPIRGDLPRPSGAAFRPRRQPRAPGAARAVAALLPARGAVRRARRAPSRARSPGPRGGAAHGRQPPRQRGPAAARARAARLPLLRGRGAGADGQRQRAHPGARGVPARGDQTQPRHLSTAGPRRDRLEPPRRGVRGDRSGVGGRAARRATSTSPPTAA